MQPNVVKMSKPFIALCPEISRANAFHLMHWLDDEAVIRYLSDSRSVSRHIAQVVERVNLPTLTHLFNQGGRFFMAYNREDAPVGFVRLVKNGPECEIVLVIGDRDNWGRKLGASAINEGMKIAFFEMRASTLIAKIHTDNMRSVNAFLRNGFDLAHETPTLKSFAITSATYLQRLRDGLGVDASNIYLTELDKARLLDVVLLEDSAEVFELEHEIERAIVVEPQQVARDVITMNSRAVLQLDRQRMEVDLVYPQDANESAGKISVSSGIGTAILGYQEGDAVDWRIDHHTRHIHIEKVLYQPEAAGDFHL